MSSALLSLSLSLLLLSSLQERKEKHHRSILDMSKKAKEYNQKNWKKKGAWSPQSLRTCLDVSCDKCALFITK
jgi:hypothetical protein